MDRASRMYSTKYVRSGLGWWVVAGLLLESSPLQHPTHRMLGHGISDFGIVVH